MFTLLTEDNRKLLSQGTILLKYPVSGEPVDIVPTDPEIADSQQLKIAAIFANEQVALEFPPLPQTPLSGMDIFLGTLNKKVLDMIEEKKWWIYIP